jgi:trans-aconitate 2-methyltransferase
MPGVREWDGASYDRVSAPQQEMGRKVLQRLVLEGDELVLDAGCGSGRVTEMLLDRLPNGRVIAVDVSPSMVAVARERIGDRVDVRVADLLELRLEERVDAIFSTATFHWISDHDTLFASLRGTLRDGGQLVAQCGGAGNVTRLQGVARDVADEPPFATYFSGWVGPWNYRGPVETEASLHAAGFTEARCWLEPAPARPPHPREFLRTVMLTPFLEQLPAELRERFVTAVHDRLGEPLTVDYMRLNIDARG